MTTQDATGQPLSSRFHFLGGDPAVDFINTADLWLTGDPVDRLTSYDDLLDWCEKAGLICGASVDALRRATAACEDDANRVLEEARSLREHLYQVFVGAATAAPLASGPLDAITGLARKAAAHSRLARCEDGFAWVLDDARGCELDWPVWELARAAVALLTSESIRHVRQCADETCGWMFVDRSRNHSRRWCDMATCGNRAKARRNYARQKARQAGG